MTELDLGIQLGLIKKRSNGLGHFDNTIILNHRLINYILSLKREKDERERAEEEEMAMTFEIAEEDTISTSPTLSDSVEKIFELPPLKVDFEWQQVERQIDHMVYKQKTILNMVDYKQRKIEEELMRDAESFVFQDDDELENQAS